MAAVRKWFVLLACLTASCLATWWYFNGQLAGEREAFRPNHEVLADWARRVRERDADLKWLHQSGRLPRLAFTEAEARRLFPIQHQQNQWQARSYFARRPNLSLRRKLEEHPKGSWLLETNALGMRRAEDPAVVQPDLRVLVVGDSHLDGLLNNEESFAAELERRLQRAHGGPSVEVLNAARGGFSLYSSLGTLERFLYLKPDLVIVGVSGNNDFTDLLQLGHIFDGDDVEFRLDSELKVLGAIAAELRPAVSSGFGAMYYGKLHPQELEFGANRASAICLEMQSVARAAGAEVLFVFVPSPSTLRWRKEPNSFAEVRKILGLGAEHLLREQELAQGFIEGLRANGCRVLDLSVMLENEPDAFFWRSNFHLNIAGHRMLADGLEPELSKRLQK